RRLARGCDGRLVVGADVRAGRTGDRGGDAGPVAALSLARLALRAALGLLDADAPRLALGPGEGARRRRRALRRRPRAPGRGRARLAARLAGGCRTWRGRVRARPEPAGAAALRADVQPLLAAAGRGARGRAARAVSAREGSH